MVGRLGVVMAALVLAPDAAEACSIKSLTAASVVSPSENSYLGARDAFLFRTKEGTPARVRSSAGDPIALELSVAFDPHHSLDSRLGFFRPVSELMADTDYVVEAEDGKLSVPFRTSGETPRIRAQLSVSVASRTVEEQSLSSASCYSGPLQDRPFRRVADIRVTSEPKTPLLMSVTTLDSVSGELIEDVLLMNGQSREGRIELPLPQGVADCLRVRLFDLAGTVLDDSSSLCVAPQAATWSFAADVFEPRPVLMPEVVGSDTSGGEPSPMESAGASRSSQGCQLAPGAGAAESWAGIFALGGLLRSRRRFAR